MKVLFLHGCQSTPGGVKPTYLAQHGHQVLNPALPDEDFNPAVTIAQKDCDRSWPRHQFAFKEGNIAYERIR